MRLFNDLEVLIPKLQKGPLVVLEKASITIATEIRTTKMTKKVNYRVAAINNDAQ